jgi:hypothetical protein
MVSFLYRMPAGIAGDVTRPSQSTIEPGQIDAAAPPTKYGVFLKMVSGKLRALGAGDAAVTPYGLLARPYPTNAANEPLGTATPPTSGLCDPMVRGYMTVKLALGTATKGGAVYVVTTAGGSVVGGDIVTSASPAGGGTATAVPNCIFMGGADADGNVEIRFNI